MFGISGWVLGLIALVFSLYAYDQQSPNGQLKYAVSSRLIYFPIDKDTSITLPQILKPEYEPAGRLYVSQVTVWNSGNLTVEPKDTRSPVVISGDHNFKILYHEVLNRKTATEGNFTFTLLNSASLGFKWRLFDPGDAVKVQIVHAGDPRSVSISGAMAKNYGISKYSPTLIFGFFAVAMIFFAAYIVDKVAISRVYERFESQNFLLGLFQFLFRGIVSGIIGLFISLIIIQGILVYTGNVSPISTEFAGIGGMEVKGI